MVTLPAEHNLIHHFKPQNVLSFGPDFVGIDLASLNILIGPNGSGKSNLIEAINLLRAAPVDLEAVTRLGGGVSEWAWKGNAAAPAVLECTSSNVDGQSTLNHALEFTVVSQQFRIWDERIGFSGPVPTGKNAECYRGFRSGNPELFVASNPGSKWIPCEVAMQKESIISQVKYPRIFPELSRLAENYAGIRIYGEWAFGRRAVFREPQKADMRNDVLEEDFSNLGLVLNRLKTRYPAAKKAILNGLKDLYDGIQDFDVLVEGGTVQVFFTEGDFVIPATRLSDGTLRYLCLLAILCDPTPPPLICIEEPELGLHPDILPNLADLLISASERTQLIVTTHSDILVDAMTERPDAVVVCEKHDGKTEMNRLSPEALAVWLDKYRLGQLWIDGQIGGKRW